MTESKPKDGRMSYKDRKRYIDAVASGRVTPKRSEDNKDKSKKRRKGVIE